MIQHRIAITGMGSISAAGPDAPSLWQTALVPRVNSKPVHLASPDRDLMVYAVDALPAPLDHERRLTRHADRSVLLTLAAAREAWRESGLDAGILPPSRAGVIVGSSRGPGAQITETERRATKRPTDALYTGFTSIPGIVSALFDLQGCSMLTAATCPSSAVALRAAMALITSGELDAVLVGGVDAPIHDSFLQQFAATGVLSTELGPHALRPFTRNRIGTVLGEGAACIVIESEASALRRGARIHGLVRHVVANCNSASRAGADEGGAALQQTTEQTLAALGWKPGQVDLLHLHGTGTPLNDATESLYVQRLFGPVAHQPHAWATKGLTGHVLGASPIFQVILSLQALQHATVPATANCLDQDPDCPIRLNLGPPLRQPLHTALCLTSGFWGNTSCIALEAPDSKDTS